mmetsp:Transcript_2917/g.7397  ORF Transcript_2917/g.7397 Transcript_2917/m.7397 type:complete len:139 (-) Transcript_2917:43-459(-)
MVLRAVSLSWVSSGDDLVDQWPVPVMAIDTLLGDETLENTWPELSEVAGLESSGDIWEFERHGNTQGASPSSTTSQSSRETDEDSSLSRSLRRWARISASKASTFEAEQISSGKMEVLHLAARRAACTKPPAPDGQRK